MELAASNKSFIRSHATFDNVQSILRPEPTHPISSFTKAHPATRETHTRTHTQEP